MPHHDDEDRLPVAMLQQVEKLLGGFGLDEVVSLTELRQSQWLERLRRAGKLRLVERNEPVGVIVSAELWGQLERLAEQLAALEDALEQEEIDRLWGERLSQARRPAPEEAEKLLRKLREQ